MRQWIGRKLGQCGLTLSGWSLAIRRIDAPRLPPVEVDHVIPRRLGFLGKATSDTAYMVLRAIAMNQPNDADDIAAGYVDAAARHWQHGDEMADRAAVDCIPRSRVM